MQYIGLSRRQLLTSLTSILLLPVSRLRPAHAATPEHLQPLIDAVTGRAVPRVGKVKLTLPALAESGNSVPLSVQVESPMTLDDHVKSIHIFSEKNPRPVIARFHLGPHSGKAQVTTRIRLAGTQHVVALAMMSDNSAWLGSAEVVVTTAACIDEKQ